MEKGDKWQTDLGVVLIFEKFDKDGDPLFTSPNVVFDKMPGIEEGYMAFPKHMVSRILTKVGEK